MNKSSNGVDYESRLCFIEVTSENPFDLFKEWFEQAKQSNLTTPEALTLATANKEGKPSARTLLLHRYDNDGFVILTNRQSRKAQELAVFPSGTMVFAWFYEKDGYKHWRQVRAEGRVVELEPNDHQRMYDDSPLYCKIRTHLCHQGAPVDWYEHKEKHDRILKEVKEEGCSLPMPDHVVSYKLIPDIMEFYLTEENSIADRAIFVKNEDGVTWKNHKIAA